MTSERQPAFYRITLGVLNRQNHNDLHKIYYITSLLPTRVDFAVILNSHIPSHGTIRSSVVGPKTDEL